MTDKTFKVVREDARGRTVTVLDGNERDARKFISDNYPRVHVEPGSATEAAPDAWLVTPDGKREVFFGPDYVDDNDKFAPGFGPHPDDNKKGAKKEAAPKKETAPAFNKQEGQ